MNMIHLNKDGTLLLNGRPLKDNPLSCLSSQVVLNEGCTIRSFFSLLDSQPMLQQLNPFIPTYIDEVRKSALNGCTMPGVEYLILRKIIELTGYPANASMRIYVTLEGMSGNNAYPIKTAGLEQLFDMPFQLGSLKHSVFGDDVSTLEFDTVYTLFELIDGICWELSFHNLPESCRI